MNLLTYTNENVLNCEDLPEFFFLQLDFFSRLQRETEATELK